VRQAGIQEKATFVQLLAKPSSVFSPALVLPAVLVLLVAAVGIAVLSSHACPRKAPPSAATDATMPLLE
jgi:hypothetical protein